MWIEGIGYAGAVLTVATYAVSTMIPLRILGLISSLTFLIYALITKDYPSALMEGTLVPLNAFKLAQMLNLTRQVRISANSDLSMRWLAPYGTREQAIAGQILFRQGDEANAMYYIESGRFRLIEGGIELGHGQIVGELGMVAPDNTRTQGLECIEPGELLRVSYTDFKQLYFQNPGFGFYFLRLISDRLFANAAAARAGAAPVAAGAPLAAAATP